MSNNQILVPVDFSDASNTAIKIAVELAKKKNAEIALLHIQNGKTKSVAENEMQRYADEIKKEGNFLVNTLIRDGNYMSEIPRQSAEFSYNLMVIGTHGYKGFREKMLGADILKLLKSIPVPVFVVQKNYLLPEAGIKKIIFPGSAHEAFSGKIEAAITIAKMFDAEIHLYSILKPGVDASDRMKENIRLAKREFENAGVKYIRVKEEQQTFSVGYSKQIMAYVKDHDIDLITLITNAARENYYFADSDKVTLLTNEAKIPVLCTSNMYADDV